MIGPGGSGPRLLLEELVGGRRPRLGGRRRAHGHLLELRASGRDVVGADAAAAADDLRSLRPPAQGHRGVLGAADARLEAPALVGVVAQVGVDAERQVGEVAQVRQHPVDVVGRDAVDHQRVDAHLLEARRRSAEAIALRPAPVLAVDAAQAVPAAAEGQPDRKPRVQQRLDRGEQRRPHDRQRLEQDQIGRLVGEQAREQPDRALALLGVDVAVDRERHGTALVAVALGDRLAGETQPPASEVHPVHRLRRAPVGGHALEEGARQPPGVRRDDVAAGGDVLAVHVAHGGRLLDERARAPQALVDGVLGVAEVR